MGPSPSSEESIKIHFYSGNSSFQSTGATHRGHKRKSPIWHLRASPKTFILFHSNQLALSDGPFLRRGPIFGPFGPSSGLLGSPILPLRASLGLLGNPILPPRASSALCRHPWACSHRQGNLSFYYNQLSTFEGENPAPGKRCFPRMDIAFPMINHGQESQKMMF